RGARRGGETDERLRLPLKIILIGDSNVGKTCVVQSFKQDTFSSVSHWVREVELYGAANIVLVLIGNKCDLESERQVEFEAASDSRPVSVGTYSSPPPPEKKSCC
ncbi:hypothetical protein CRUP_010123, partial [Coryphaenoides rupestris]